MSSLLVLMNLEWLLRRTFKVQLSGMWSEEGGYVPGPYTLDGVAAEVASKKA